MDWKEKAFLWFTRAAQFWLVQTVLVYLWACVVASKPIGPKDYVRFNYHVIQWVPSRTPGAAPAAYFPNREDKGNTPHMNFMGNH